ncbi:MAG TPA: hypothetical protein VHB73_05105 [Alphaproteobacteria bacterium]|nr:hypothetical protein [Alphaproteobacteria bacterium]
MNDLKEVSFDDIVNAGQGDNPAWGAQGLAAALTRYENKIYAYFDILLGWHSLGRVLESLSRFTEKGFPPIEETVFLNRFLRDALAEGRVQSAAGFIDQIQTARPALFNEVMDALRAEGLEKIFGRGRFPEELARAVYLCSAHPSLLPLISPALAVQTLNTMETTDDVHTIIEKQNWVMRRSHADQIASDRRHVINLFVLNIIENPDLRDVVSEAHFKAAMAYTGGAVRGLKATLNDAFLWPIAVEFVCNPATRTLPEAILAVGAPLLDCLTPQQAEAALAAETKSRTGNIFGLCHQIAAHPISQNVDIAAVLREASTSMQTPVFEYFGDATPPLNGEGKPIAFLGINFSTSGMRFHIPGVFPEGGATLRNVLPGIARLPDPARQYISERVVHHVRAIAEDGQALSSVARQAASRLPQIREALGVMDAAHPQWPLLPRVTAHTPPVC